jgi:hypothetical protein
VTRSKFHNFGIRGFGGPEDKRSRHSGVKYLKSHLTTELDVNFRISKNQDSEYQKS